MPRNRTDEKFSTKEIGLEAVYRVMKFALNTEHIHYGLFEPDIPVGIAHLKIAQERYFQRLLEAIPAETKSILDVGCGAGKTAELLLERGYQVDCVSPGKALTAIAAERLDTRARIYRCRFEELSVPTRYDLVLFSESLQYIPVDVALEKSMSILNPGGHILISDFFSVDRKEKSTIGGGHRFEHWREIYSRYPLDVVIERDITAETAPLHDIVLDFSQDVLRPLWQSMLGASTARWPMRTRIGRLVFRREIDKIEKRRLSTDRSGASFRYFKIYKTYLFKMRDPS
jgi:SAM-dependent methyltransferase